MAQYGTSSTARNGDTFKNATHRRFGRLLDLQSSQSAIDQSAVALVVVRSIGAATIAAPVVVDRPV